MSKELSRVKKNSETTEKKETKKKKKKKKFKQLTPFGMVVHGILNLTILILGIILIIFDLVFFFYDNREVFKSTIDTHEDYSASIVMVGDALIHEAVYNAYKSGSSYNFNGMMKFIKPYVQNYDLRYYNQETVLGGKQNGLSSYPQFNSPTEVGDAFMDSGFNLISLATNHTMDNYYIKGEKILKNSRTYWNDKEEKLNVIAAGSYTSNEEKNKEKIGEINGIKYCFLSYTASSNGINPPSGKGYLVNTYSEAAVKKEVDYYKDKVDFVIVAMHWGSEYTHTPTSQEKKIANYLASIGVDIVIGSHPHVLQPITFIGDTLVIYSLGNFVSSQGTPETKGIASLIGLMPNCTIEKHYYHGVTTYNITNVEATLIYTDKSNSGKNGRFVVYPFQDLNTKTLSDYKSLYTKYGNIVTSMSDKVTMKGL